MGEFTKVIIYVILSVLILILIEFKIGNERAQHLGETLNKILLILEREETKKWVN